MAALISKFSLASYWALMCVMLVVFDEHECSHHSRVSSHQTRVVHEYSHHTRLTSVNGINFIGSVNCFEARYFVRMHVQLCIF